MDTLHQCRFLLWLTNHMAPLTIAVYPNNVLKCLIITNHMSPVICPLLSLLLFPLHSIVLLCLFLLLLLPLPWSCHHPHNDKFQISCRYFSSRLQICLFNCLLIASSAMWECSLSSPYATWLWLIIPSSTQFLKPKRSKSFSATSSTFLHPSNIRFYSYLKQIVTSLNISLSYSSSMVVTVLQAFIISFVVVLDNFPSLSLFLVLSVFLFIFLTAF